MGERKRITPAWVVLPAVIIFVLTYLVYFFSLELPNAPIPGSDGQKYSRMDLWQLAIPGFVPQTRSLPAQAISRLVEVRYLPQRVPIVGYGLLIVGGATAIGACLLRLIESIGGDRLTARAEISGAPPTMTGLQPGRLERVERLVLAYGLGMSAVSTAVLGLGLVGVFNRWGTLFVLAVWAAAGAVAVWRNRQRRVDRPAPVPVRVETASKHRRANGATRTTGAEAAPTSSIGRKLAFTFGWIAAGLFLLIAFLGAMLPATDFDVREYHVQGPKEFYLAGRISFAAHNVYMNMPFGTEMFHLLGMIIAGDWWWGSLVGQFVLATFAPMTALGVWCVGCRLFGSSEAWLAALIYITTPWVYRISIIPYTENALCFYLLTALLALVAVLQGGKTSKADTAIAGRKWLVVGLLAGAAVSCKYTALVSTVLPLGVAPLTYAWIRRLGSSIEPNSSVSTLARVSLRAAIVFSLGVVIAFGPWFVKNAAVAGNPMYPLLYSVFGGRNWTEEKNAKWEWGHRVALLVALGVQTPPNNSPVHPHDPQHAISLRQLATNAVDVTAQADWLSPLLFGFAPLALFASRGRSSAAWLWLLVLYLFFQWWLLTHRLDRFWVPLIPVVAVLAGAGATWHRSTVWQMFVVVVFAAAVFFNFAYASTALCGFNEYTARLEPRKDPTDRVVNWMNSHLPADARVLAVGAADLFHLDRDVVYNTVFDDSIFEQLVRDQSPEQIAASMRERAITHLYVNWAEINRYRAPGSYGFTWFITPQVFRDLEWSGVLKKIVMGPPFGPVELANPFVETPAWALYEVGRPRTDAVN